MHLLAGTFALPLAVLVLAAPAPPPSGSFVVRKEGEGIVVRTAPSGLRSPWGLAAGRIDAAPEAVLAHLTDFAHLAGAVPRLKEARVIRRSDDEAIVYFYLDLPWPVADRDYTARYRWGRGDDGTIRLLVEEANDLGPTPSAAVRVGLLRGLWELRRNADGSTAASYHYLADLGGLMTQGMIDETAWKQPLETIRGVRRALAKP